MSNQVEFLRSLAQLMAKHDMALCSREVRNSSEVYFIENQFSRETAARIYTGRLHSTPYEIRLIADRIEREQAIASVTVLTDAKTRKELAE